MRLLLLLLVEPTLASFLRGAPQERHLQASSQFYFCPLQLNQCIHSCSSQTQEFLPLQDFADCEAELAQCRQDPCAYDGRLVVVADTVEGNVVADADNDGDGLTNGQEVDLGTVLENSDTVRCRRVVV